MSDFSSSVAADLAKSERNPVILPLLCERRGGGGGGGGMDEREKKGEKWREMKGRDIS